MTIQESHLQPTQNSKLWNYKIFNHPQAPTVKSRGGVLLAVVKTIHAEEIALPSSLQIVAVRTFLHYNSLQHLSTSHKEYWRKADNKLSPTHLHFGHRIWSTLDLIIASASLAGSIHTYEGRLKSKFPKIVHCTNERNETKLTGELSFELLDTL